jgi:hypothetical protein
MHEGTQTRMKEPGQASWRHSTTASQSKKRHHSLAGFVEGVAQEVEPVVDLAGAHAIAW